MRMILCGILALSLSLAPRPGEGQEATLTIEVNGWGAIANVQHECQSIQPNGRVDGYVGFMETCPIYAVDSSGAPTKASVFVSAADTSRVRVEVVMDTLPPLQVRYYLTIEILRRGNSMVEITAAPVLFLAGYFPDRPPPYERLDTLGVMTLYGTPGPDGVFVESETMRLCAYQGGFGDAVAVGVPADGFLCPTFGRDLPMFPVTFRGGRASFPTQPRPIPLLAN